MKKTFAYNKETYNLQEFTVNKNNLSSFYKSFHLKDLPYCSQKVPDIPFEKMLLGYIFSTIATKGKSGFPVDINSFSELATTAKHSNKNNFKLLSTDISKNEPQIDLKLYHTFNYGSSDICTVFGYIKANNETSYHSLINWFSRNGKSKDEAGNIEETVKQHFEKFTGAKITANKNFRNGEIDIAVYKDKKLILIEVKSTYGIIKFEERFKHEKELIYAGHQLNRAIKALREDEKLLAEITGDSSIKFDELKQIKSLIVSTSFEFDNEEFSGHRKISLLELMVCLRGNANLLANFNKLSKQLTNEQEGLEMWRKLAEESSLCDYDKEKQTVDDFLRALDSNIWEKVLSYN